MAIGNLVANLAVDSAPFKKGLKGATGSLKSFAGGMAGILAPLAGGLAVAFGAGKSITAFKEHDAAQKKLQAVITATGGAAGLTANEISEMAAGLQDVTNFSDEATVEAAGLLATFKNIKGDTFERSIVAMQDMATVMGTDVSAGAVQMGKALNDPIKGAAALAEVGVAFTDSQKEMIETMQEAGDMAGAQGVILAELEGQFGGAAVALADPWTQAQNSLGDVAETIGGALMPGIGMLSGMLKDGADFLLSYKDTFVEWGNVAREWLVVAFAAGEFAINNWQTIGQLAVAQMKLSLFAFYEDSIYFWTTKFPAAISWAWDQMGNIAFTTIDYTLTLFINLGKNIRAVWQAVINFFATGKFNVDWTPILEGAKNTIEKMPNIPERVIGVVEKRLASDVQALKNTLGTSFDDIVAERMGELEKTTDKFAGVAAQGASTGTLDATATTEVKKSEQKFAGVQSQGSSEAFALLARSQMNSPALTESKKQTGLLKKLVAKPAAEPVMEVGIG